MPLPGAYWLAPAAMAAWAASLISTGPSSSGKPWPRLIAPVLSARVVISSKIVTPREPSGESRLAPVAARCQGNCAGADIQPWYPGLGPADAVGSDHETRCLPWLL